MTTLYQENVRCVLCGTETECSGISSTSAFGSPDLDGRSPEPQRSSMAVWVNRCPGCGYCAEDISVSRQNAQVVVNSQDYKNQLTDATYPELAASFLCKAMLDREAQDYKAATWALIHAAWVCDDSVHAKQAIACRRKAADMLTLAEEHGQQMAREAGSNTAILVDLLRRSEQVDQARQMILDRRGGITEDIFVKILAYQTRLLDDNDFSCHVIDEAVGGVASRP